jgi:hypothetical protein
MSLVGMQDDGLPISAMRSCASVSKRLHAMQRQADGVRVMSMRIIAVAREVRFEP